MPSASRAMYRVWQFWRTVTVRSLSDEGRTKVEDLLSASELKLFETLGRHEQRHAYGVMQWLARNGHVKRELLAAALLHDVGKKRVASRFWDRPLAVVVQAIAPSVAAKWSRGEAKGWRRAFVVRAHHAEWGAQDAEAAGCSETTVRLIRYHQDSPESVRHLVDSQMLRQLQRADESN